MAILLSIKPKFADMILSGVKKVEYRKALASIANDRIFLYATAPIKKVVGEVKVKRADRSENKEAVWACYLDCSGITKEEFDEYFKDKKCASWYFLEEPIRYKKPQNIRYFGVKSAPRNFIYLKDKR